MQVEWPKHTPHFVEESIGLLSGNSISSWRLHKTAGSKQWRIEILLDLIDALVDGGVLAIDKPSFEDGAGSWVDGLINGDESTVAVHLVVGELALVERGGVEGSAHA